VRLRVFPPRRSASGSWSPSRRTAASESCRASLWAGAGQSAPSRSGRSSRARRQRRRKARPCATGCGPRRSRATLRSGLRQGPLAGPSTPTACALGRHRPISSMARSMSHFSPQPVRPREVLELPERCEGGNARGTARYLWKGRSPERRTGTSRRMPGRRSVAPYHWGALGGA
jgi:hypothetical protein